MQLKKKGLEFKDLTIWQKQMEKTDESKQKKQTSDDNRVEINRIGRKNFIKED